jgi:hypothetical protein
VSSREYGLSRQEVCEILARHVAAREKLDPNEHQRVVEFDVVRDRMTGRLQLDFVKVRFDAKPKNPVEPPAVPTFM